MKQEQEQFGQQFRLVDRGVDTNTPREWNPIDTSGERGLFQRHSGETDSAGRLQNQERWRFWTRRVPDGNPSSQNDKERIEDSREGGEEKVPQKTYVPKPNGFEPFLNQDTKEESLFVNKYGGSFAQKMELDRRGVERALKIAHLDGKVFLTTLAPSHSRAEAQGNELAAKRFLLFERKTQKVEEENPYKRVVSVPEGWRIEINDQRITEELTERELTGEKLQRAFIRNFNQVLKGGILECVRREKLSSEKDTHFRYKLFWSGTHAASPYVGSASWLITNPSLMLAPVALGVTLLIYGGQNICAPDASYWQGENACERHKRIIRTPTPGVGPQ